MAMKQLMTGLSESPALPLKLVMTFGKVAPLSADVLYKISKLPDVIPAHTTYTLLPDTAIAGTSEDPALLLRFFITLGNVVRHLEIFYTGYQRFPGVFIIPYHMHIIT